MDSDRFTDRQKCVSCPSTELYTTIRCAPCARKNTQSQTSCQRRRIEAGLCEKCGERKLASTRKCALCLEKDRRRQDKKRQERQDAGLCNSCGKPKLSTTLLCAPCANRRAQKEADRRLDRIEAGLCVDCGKAPSVEGISHTGTAYIRCDDCLDKVMEYSAKRREQQRQAKRAREQALLEEGLCLGCVKPFPEASENSKWTGEPHRLCRPCSGNLGFFRKHEREYGEKRSSWGSW